MKESQTQALKAAFDRGEKITALDALQRFRCLRLAARVYTLIQAGENIVSQKVDGETYHEYFNPEKLA